MQCKLYKGFGEGKKEQKFPYLKGKTHMFPYLDSQFLLVIARILKKFYFSCLPSIQIWLIPVVDDRQSTHLSKLRKRTLITTLEWTPFHKEIDGILCYWKLLCTANIPKTPCTDKYWKYHIRAIIETQCKPNIGKDSLHRHRLEILYGDCLPPAVFNSPWIELSHLVIQSLRLEVF